MWPLIPYLDYDFGTHAEQPYRHRAAGRCMYRGIGQAVVHDLSQSDRLRDYRRSVQSGVPTGMQTQRFIGREIRFLPGLSAGLCQ